MSDTTTQYTVELDEHHKVWVRCTAAAPVPQKGQHPARTGTHEFAGMRIFHPDAQLKGTDDRVGWDEQYRCPHCRESWWVECDG